MTRINLIKAEELYYKFLLAEIRELPRIFNYVEKFGIDINKIPSDFTLNKGHIKFFSNKLKFLFERYCLLYYEANKRGYKINYSIEGLYNKYSHLLIEENQIKYIPTIKDLHVSQERLNQKLLNLLLRGNLKW